MLEGGAGCDSQNCETCADGFHLGSVRYLLFTVGKCQHVFCRMSNIVKALNARCKYCISPFSGFSRFSPRSRSELDLFSHSLPKNRWNCWWEFFYRLNALPVTQSTVWKHWRKLYILCWYWTSCDCSVYVYVPFYTVFHKKNNPVLNCP